MDQRAWCGQVGAEAVGLGLVGRARRGTDGISQVRVDGRVRMGPESKRGEQDGSGEA